MTPADDRVVHPGARQGNVGIHFNVGQNQLIAANGADIGPEAVTATA